MSGNPAVLIKEVLLYGEGGAVDVLTADGQIAEIGTGLKAPKGSDVIEAAGQVLQTQIPPEKREAAGKSIEADVKKFVEESVPVLHLLLILLLLIVMVVLILAVLAAVLLVLLVLLVI